MCLREEKSYWSLRDQQQKKVMNIPENTEFPEVLAERGMV